MGISGDINVIDAHVLKIPWHFVRQALGVVDTDQEEWSLNDLDIDFPKEWASSEFMDGRNW